MSAGLAVQSGNLTGTNGAVSGQINPAYSVSSGYEGVSRPLDDMAESNLAPHFRCYFFIHYFDVFDIL